MLAGHPQAHSTGCRRLVGGRELGGPMPYRRILVALAVVLLLLPACSRSRPTAAEPVVTTSPVPRPPRVFDAAALASELRRAGLDVAGPEPTSTAIFGSASRHTVLVTGGRRVLVDTFATSEEASRVASQIQPDGSGGPFEDGVHAQVQWKEPPHFFHRERLIVTYFQSGHPSRTPADSRILEALERVMGPQFAGYR